MKQLHPLCLFYSDENGVSTIEEQYADEVKARVADVFGTTLMEEVYKNITDLLKDTTMVSLTHGLLCELENRSSLFADRLKTFTRSNALCMGRRYIHS